MEKRMIVSETNGQHRLTLPKSFVEENGIDAYDEFTPSMTSAGNIVLKRT